MFRDLLYRYQLQWFAILIHAFNHIYCFFRPSLYNVIVYYQKVNIYIAIIESTFSSYFSYEHFYECSGLNCSK